MVKSGKFYKKRGEKMFTGEYRHSVDTKGRVIMPAKFRETLGNKFFVTRGLDGNLQIYSWDEWNKVYEKLSTLPTLVDKNSRALSRHLLSGCVECEVDKQGRILIPSSLRLYAGIDKDIVIIGNGNKVELWSLERWDNYMNDIDPDSVAANLCDLGILI